MSSAGRDGSVPLDPGDDAGPAGVGLVDLGVQPDLAEQRGDVLGRVPLARAGMIPELVVSILIRSRHRVATSSSAVPEVLAFSVTSPSSHLPPILPGGPWRAVLLAAAVCRAWLGAG